MADKPLTRTQAQILRNVRDHDDPMFRGFYGLAQHGGAGRSLQSLIRRGWVAWENYPGKQTGRYVLAEAGAAALVNHEARRG